MLDKRSHVHVLTVDDGANSSSTMRYDTTLRGSPLAPCILAFESPLHANVRLAECGAGFTVKRFAVANLRHVCASLKMPSIILLEEGSSCSVDPQLEVWAATYMPAPVVRG
jgi:hypothetical protein